MPLFRRLARAATLAAIVAAGCARDAEPEPKAAASAPPPKAPAPTPSPDRTEFVGAVDHLAADALQHGPVAGLSIAVFVHGQPVLAKGYGFADIASGTAAVAETSYPIASVTKQFTAALVLRLADQGKLSLDDPLSRFFPNARAKIGALTLRHLLDHTSGLTRPGPAPRKAAVSVLTRGGTARAQGETWDYSNYNFSLLGLVLEQVTGRDYPAFVQEEIVGPLGLPGTGYCEDGTPLPGRTHDYLAGQRSVAPTTYWSQPRFFAAGGLCSTVLDLVRWEKALEDGTFISPAMLGAMRTPTDLPGLVEADYGFGTRLGMTGAHRKFGHTGAGQSNKAVVARYPDDDVTIAVLLNTERPNARVTATGLEERIAQLFFDVSDVPVAAPGASDDLRRYAGQYRLGGALIRVTSGASGLVILPGVRRRAHSQFVAVGDDVFVPTDDPSVALRFQVNENQTRAFTRYRNGWFSGVGIRTGPS